MAEGEVNPGLVSANRLQNAVDNPIFVRPGNGTLNQGFTGDAANVSVQGTVTVVATALDIRALTHVALKDSVQIGDGVNLADFVVINAAFGATPTAFPFAGKFEITPTTYDDGDAVPMLMDAEGRPQVDVISGGGGQEFNEDDPTPGVIVAPSLLIERDDVLTTVTPVEGDWIGVRGSSRGALWVAVDQHTLTNSNPLPISRDNAANGEDNPLFVTVVEAGASTNEVHNFQTETDLAIDTEANHDIVAVGLLKTTMVTLAATGAARIEVINDATGTPSTERIAHTNGRQGDYVEVNFRPPLETPTGQTLRLRVKNRQGVTNDIHSSHSGWDV